MKWQRGELLKVIGLYLLIIPFFNALNATGYENSQIQGYFGASGTEFMYMNIIPMFVPVAGIPLALVLARRFQLRSLMYIIIILAFAMNTFSAFAPGIFLFTLSRSLLSFLTIFGIMAALIPIVMRYNPALNMAIMYGIVQFIMQGSGLLYKYLGALFAHIYDWRTSILMVNINFLLCIILTCIFIRKNDPPPKHPFSFDFRGWGLLVLFLLPLLFLTAEGQNRNWFSDTGVMIASVSILLAGGLYFLHARNTVNPLIDFKVFRYGNVLAGTFLFFLTGAINGTGSVILGFMGGILGFDDLYMARTHLFTFAGIAVSIPACTYLLYKRVHLQVAAIAGFVSFALFHLLMHFRFYPGISSLDFMWPLVFKGLGIGFLYVLSSLYISENVPKPLSTSRMMSGVIARVVFALLLGGSVLSTMVSKLTVMHNTGISQQISDGNREAAEKRENARNYYIFKGLKPSQADRKADDPLRHEMGKSAAMLAYKDIYLVLAAVSFLPAFVIILLRAGRRPVDRVEVEPLPL